MAVALSSEVSQCNSEDGICVSGSKRKGSIKNGRGKKNVPPTVPPTVPPNYEFSESENEIFPVSKKYIKAFANKYNLVQVDMDTGKINYDYKLPELKEGKKNGRPNWYIEYYVWDVQKNKLDRKRPDIPAQYKTEKEKRRYAADFIKSMTLLLESGFVIDREKMKESDRRKFLKAKGNFYTLDTARVKYLQDYAKKRQKPEQDFSYIKSTIKLFRDWLEKRTDFSPKTEWLGNITNEIVEDYFEFRQVEQEIANSTYNVERDRLKAFFNYTIRNQMVGENFENPASFIDLMPKDYGTKNIPYTDHEVKLIKEELINTHPEIWQFCQFTYYSMMRGTEIRRLKIRDIDLVNNTISIWSSNSKTKKCDKIPLIPELKEILINEMQIQNYPEDYFVFGKEGTPSQNKVYNCMMSKKFRPVKEKLGLSEDHTLYGFKHKAACDWYDKTKDILRIALFCRHRDTKITLNYLKSMGRAIIKDREYYMPQLLGEDCTVENAQFQENPIELLRKFNELAAQLSETLKVLKRVEEERDALKTTITLLRA